MAPKRQSFLSEISGNRGAHCELSEAQRAAILTARDLGKSVRHVAAEARVDTTTVTQTQKRWQTTHTLKSSPRSGRPSIFSDRGIRRLKIYIRRNPRATYNEIREDLSISASDSTLLRYMRQFYVDHWRAAKRIPLSEEDEKDRY